MKTNDVTERYKKDELGISIDVGRPNRGTTFREIEKITIESKRGSGLAMTHFLSILACC